MIPGFIISIFTFPGVIIHEWAHKIACDYFEVKVLQVKYFQLSPKLFGGEAGYVIHEGTSRYLATLGIGIAPLVVNTIFCVIFGLIAHNMTPDSLMSMVFLWLGFSAGGHSFPSNKDMDNVRKHGKEENKAVGLFSHALFGIMVVLNLGRMFWLDFIYAYLLMQFVGAVA